MRPQGQHSTLLLPLALASAHAEAGQLPSKGRDVLDFYSLFAPSIRRHTGRSQQEETRHQTTYHKHLRNSLSSCLTVSCLQFTFSSSKILSTAPNKKIKTKMTPFIQTTYYTLISLICIICSDPDSYHLQVARHACASPASPGGLCIIIMHATTAAQKAFERLSFVP